MANFTVLRIADNVYSLNTPQQASFYVVVGSKYAAVIDTGITVGEKIMPAIRNITDKETILVVTHAHLDHMHHIDEFATVYMCHDELALPEAILKKITGGREMFLANTIDIRTGSVIDLGEDILEICQVPGHTPGSVVVLEKNNNMLFTGDAIGSGFGVFMQINGATTLEEYRVALQNLLKWLADRGGLMSFWGGHNYQQFQSTLVPHYNPLSVGLMADLLTLVDKLITGEIVGRMSNVPMAHTEEMPMYASFGRAEIQYLKSRIKRS